MLPQWHRPLISIEKQALEIDSGKGYGRPTCLPDDVHCSGDGCCSGRDGVELQRFAMKVDIALESEAELSEQPRRRLVAR